MKSGMRPNVGLLRGNYAKHAVRTKACAGKMRAYREEQREEKGSCG